MAFQTSSFQQNAFQEQTTAGPPWFNNDFPNPVLRVPFFITCLTLAACVGTSNMLPLTGRVQDREIASTKYEPRKVQQWEVVPNNLPLNAVAAQAPLDQNDQPNPVLRTRTVQPEIPPDLLTSTLNQAANQPPFDQSDWSNPVLRVRTVQPEIPAVSPNLATNPIPFNYKDQPNPTLARKVQQPDLNYTLLTSTLNQAATHAAFENYDFPNPLIKRIMQIDPIPDLLTSTLNQAVNQPPFENFNQPNPAPARKVQQPPDPPNLNATTLAPVVASPFYQNEQPNPVLRKGMVQPEIPVNIKPLISVVIVNEALITKIEPRRVFQTDIPANILPLTAPVAGTPFVPGPRPNPVLRVRTVVVDPVPDLLTSTLNQAATQTAFNQDDWPNPVLRTRTVQPEPPPNLTPFIPPVVYQLRALAATRYTPRKVFQWDQPGNRLPLLSAIAAQQPFSQDVWDNPRGPTKWLASQVLDVSRYADDVPQNPFYLTHQPNPVIKGNRVHLELQQPALTLKFFNPVHRRPLTVAVPRKGMVQPEIVGNLLPLVTPPLKPVTPSNFPNPVLRVRTVQPEIPANILGTTTPPRPPFYQNTWPNPIWPKTAYGYWVFQFDRLNIGLQPVGWSGINDAQTPGWVATGEACTWDSTVATFDSTVITFDTDCAAIWGPVDDSGLSACTADSTAINASNTSETADTICEVCTADTTEATADTTLYTADLDCSILWSPVNDADTPGWTPINDADNPGWSTVITNPAGAMAQ